MVNSSEISWPGGFVTLERKSKSEKVISLLSPEKK